MYQQLLNSTSYITNTPASAALSKMQKRRREWGMNGNGNAQHVQEIGASGTARGVCAADVQPRPLAGAGSEKQVGTLQGFPLRKH